MMGLHLYCIVSRGTLPEASLVGIDGEPVECVPVGPLGVWCSELPRRPRPGITRIRDHDRVIREAISEVATPLPIRFGQWLPDSAALRRRMEASVEDYRAALAEVAGSLEFGVRFEAADPTPEPSPEPSRTGSGAGSGTETSTGRGVGPGAGPGVGPGVERGAGRAYLHSLGQRSRTAARALERGRVLAAELDRALEGGVRRSLVTAANGAGGLAEVAHLVPGSGVEQYRRRVERFGRDQPGVRVRTSGPWPPYSFSP